MDKQEIQKIYSLSPMQEGMLFHAIKKDNLGAYFEQLSFTLMGELDINFFEMSFNQLISRYEIFRTVFIYEKIKSPKQVVLKKRTSKIYFMDISYLNGNDMTDFVEEFKKNERNKGFDLSKDILIKMSVFKTDADCYKVILSFHHILIDGWCLGIVLKELFENYEALENGRDLKPDMVRPYSDYIKWIEKQNREEAYAFWKKYLYGYEDHASMPRYYHTGKEQEYKKDELIFSLNRATTDRLAEISKTYKVTISSLFRTIWGILLQRYNNTDDVAFGSVVSGRVPEIEGIESMVGLFINTVPVRVKVCKNQTFSELMNNVHEYSSDSQKYEYVQLAKIQSKTSLKSELFDHILAFENYPMEKEISNLSEGGSFYGFSIKDLDVCEQTNYDFNIIVIPGDELSIKLSYNSSIFDKSLIAGIERHLKKIADAIAENPNIPVGEIRIIDDEEERKLLLGFNGTRADYPENKTICELFEEKAAKTPDNTALVFGDSQLTYSEFNERSNQLARALRNNGLVPGAIVGLMARRSFEMLIGIYGILKAGGAYLPIDPDYPSDRIQYLLSDSKAELLLINCDVELDSGAKIIDLRDKSLYTGDASNLKKLSASRDLAYIIYTSGSTGKPKGAVIENRSVVNLLFALQKMYPLSEKDSFLLKTTFTFDGSIPEIFGWFLGNGQLVILEQGAEKDPARMLAAIDKNNVTHMNFVPSMLNAFINNIETKDVSAFNKLKYIFAGGEALSRDTVRKFNSLSQGVKLENLYGPTETTVYATGFSVEMLKDELNVPIGMPLQNTKLYILNRNNQLQPTGIAGELCIGGAGLARGYLNRSDLTSEKFVLNPFSEGEKMYRSGDLARWLPNGTVEFLGRIDHQVKIRGYRIELGEIECKILSHSSVKEAVVIARDDTNGSKQLCAYIVGSEAETSSLREHLAKDLPEYMIPAFFIKLDKLPLTQSGKIDRKSLPELSAIMFSESQHVSPETEDEKKMAEIWEEVLGVDKIGIHDNFFDLGGDSLSIIRVLSASAMYSWGLSIQDFYKRKTIKNLIAKIKGEISDVKVLEEKEKDISIRTKKTEIGNISVSGVTSEYKNILLTGATGYLGIHILNELIHTTNAKVYCLIRGSSQSDSEKRLQKLLQFYFGNEYANISGKRIAVVNGDITIKNFNLPEKLYDEIGQKIDAVIHTAALVKHYGEYEEFEKINVAGTREAIRLCVTYGKKLHHISTISVSGDFLDQDGRELRFCEDDFYVGQNYESNVYVRSKFEAENLIFKAMDNGLKAVIYRVGNLTGRFADGHFQINITENKFYNILKSFIQLGKIPEEMLEQEIEFTPIDFCSKAVVELSRLPESDKRVFHVYNHKTVKMRQIVKILGISGNIMNAMPVNDFVNYVNNISKDAYKNKMLDGIIGDFSNQKGLGLRSSVAVSSQITQKYLKLIGFEWPEIDETYIDKIYQYMIKIGYIES